MRKLLVTGGAGFIGTNFVHYWLSAHPEDRLIVLDALTYAGSRSNLAAVMQHSSLRFEHGDICDYALVSRLLREEAIDTIVHFAAESHVDRSIDAPDAFIQTNIVGTHVLLRAAREYWLDNPAWNRPCRFHHVSTDEVYGDLGPQDPPFTENTPYAPSSPYSASKAAADHLVRAYHRTYGLPVTISNCSNNYGPWQFPEKLIPVVLLNAIAGKPIPVYGKGENVRDWLHVDDHCRALDAILAAGKSGSTYNVGARCEQTNIGVVRKICQLLDTIRPGKDKGGYQSLITYVTDRPGHDRRYAIDPSRMEEELGWKPQMAWERGLQHSIEWYLANLDWCRDRLGGRLPERRGRYEKADARA